MTRNVNNIIYILFATAFFCGSCNSQKKITYGQDTVYIEYNSLDPNMEFYESHSGKEKHLGYHFTYVKPSEASFENRRFRFSYKFFPKSILEEGLGYDLQIIHCKKSDLSKIHMISSSWFSNHTPKQINSYFGKYTSVKPALYLVKDINGSNKVELIQMIFHYPTYE
jgi:hypothetical protein